MNANIVLKFYSTKLVFKKIWENLFLTKNSVMIKPRVKINKYHFLNQSIKHVNHVRGLAKPETWIITMKRWNN
jgi:hypothetical protein